MPLLYSSPAMVLLTSAKYITRSKLFPKIILKDQVGQASLLVMSPSWNFPALAEPS